MEPKGWLDSFIDELGEAPALRLSPAEVEAFEEGVTTGVTNLFGFDNDEQEAEADAAKVALNTKKFESLVEKIDASDLNNEEKMRQKAELQKALDNSGDVDWFGDADARKADRTFSQYEKK